ncbi:MAG: carboxypeptidase regulatory-like domain-containing protein [Candidatus Bathyarchaeota archaeon]|nr:MAG: carboxypeptidase regulatory-like domain-containing protein [Candidatus Bathyarchaeota archaeon]
MKIRYLMKSRFQALTFCIMLSLTLIIGVSLMSKPVLGVEPVTGAIWTTDSDGDQVNGNLFKNRRSVYLAGGPHKIGTLGLADGEYCFQVTDPKGKILLSSDDVEKRTFYVENGVIDSVAPGGHNSNPDPDGEGIIIQLAPFGPAPQKSGGYKVWVTKVQYYDAFGGFIPSLSKTDNFKVGRLDEVPKYFELLVTSGISGLDGMAFYVDYSIEVDGAPSSWTTGQLLFAEIEGSLEVFRYETTFALGTYIYWNFSAVNTVSWNSDQHGPEEIIESGMVNREICPLFVISGTKYSSKPTDLDQIPVAGSLIQLFNGTLTADTNTDSSGYYEFIGTAPGNYNVSTEGSGGTIWYEFNITGPEDQTFDFYDYNILEMAGLQSVGIDSFRIVFTPSNDGSDTYKFSSTNPGSFFLNVETFGEPGSLAHMEIILPPAKGIDSPNFLLHHTNIGSDSLLDLHIYTDSSMTMEVTGFTVEASPDGKQVEIIGTMPSSGSLFVVVHVDFQIAGSLTEGEMNSFFPNEYTFTVLIYGSIQGVTRSLWSH